MEFKAPAAPPPSRAPAEMYGDATTLVGDNINTFLLGGILVVAVAILVVLLVQGGRRPPSA